MQAITKQRKGTEGWQTIVHWRGRRPRDLQRSLPEGTEAVLVILDRISHALARKIRVEAARRGLPVLIMRRKWSSRPVAADLDYQQNTILRKPGRGRVRNAF